ncbi:hypothetical protein [Parabacteroides goldsteinii]|uniref:hypothetical protein n=1 Tax=Parabacteroides goldsteinii TaxID=328812 RepID=UPI00272AA5F9|nr:hypothetical protein [Parabacteroides goldsteinii]
MAKIFITKYALTKGIIEKEADIHSFRDGSKFAYVRGEFIGYKMIVDAFYNYESAIQRAEEVRKKRIASLKRQIEKLEKLSFNKQ